MDFKVAGTHKGITSIQMDLKIDGLTPEIIKRAFEQTHAGRDQIIDEVILKAIAEPRKEVSEFAPKMISMKIKPDKIREVIGPGGKVIKKIIDDCGVQIDIDDDGTVRISATSVEASAAAVAAIEEIVREVEVGQIYKGKVTRLMAFGAFVELLPGREGLCHISQLDKKRVEKVEDYVNVGDELEVKVTEIDQKGRVNVSHKVLL